MMLKETLLPTVTLFGSFSTLFCCALPALFVAVGAGASLIGLVSAFPQLIWISQHKISLFVFSGLMLIVSAAARYASRNAPCPTDLGQAQSCRRLRRLSLSVFSVSVALYVTGFYFAFVASHIS